MICNCDISLIYLLIFSILKTDAPDLRSKV